MGKRVDDLKVKLARVAIPIAPYIRVNEEGDIEHVDAHIRHIEVGTQYPSSRWVEVSKAYHVAPAGRRSRIDAEGLRAQTPLVPGGLKGVYLWDSLEAAQAHAQPGDVIYEVDLPVKQAYRDPNPRAKGAVVYPVDIPVANIRAVTDAPVFRREMWHGTKADFTEFDERFQNPEDYGRGFYATDDKAQAERFGTARRVEVTLYKPYRFDTPTVDRVLLDELEQSLQNDAWYQALPGKDLDEKFKRWYGEYSGGQEVPSIYDAEPSTVESFLNEDDDTHDTSRSRLEKVGIDGYLFGDNFPVVWHASGIRLIPEPTLPDSSTQAVLAPAPPIEQAVAALHDEGAMDILESYFGNRMNTPLYGGCLITAQALQMVYGGEIHALITTSQPHIDDALKRGRPPMIDHFVVKIGEDQYIDGAGLHTGLELVEGNKFPWQSDPFPDGKHWNQVVPAPQEWIDFAGENYILSPPGAAEDMANHIRNFRGLPDAGTNAPRRRTMDRVGVIYAHGKPISPKDRENLPRWFEEEAEPYHGELYRGLWGNRAALDVDELMVGQEVQFKLLAASESRRTAGGFVPDESVPRIALRFVTPMAVKQSEDIQNEYQESEYLVSGRFKVVAVDTDAGGYKQYLDIREVTLEYVGPYDKESGVRELPTNEGATLSPIRPHTKTVTMNPDAALAWVADSRSAKQAVLDFEAGVEQDEKKKSTAQGILALLETAKPSTTTLYRGFGVANSIEEVYAYYRENPYVDLFDGFTQSERVAEDYAEKNGRRGTKVIYILEPGAPVSVNVSEGTNAAQESERIVRTQAYVTDIQMSGEEGYPIYITLRSETLPDLGTNAPMDDVQGESDEERITVDGEEMSIRWKADEVADRDGHAGWGGVQVRTLDGQQMGRMSIVPATEQLGHPMSRIPKTSTIGYVEVAGHMRGKGIASAMAKFANRRIEAHFGKDWHFIHDWNLTEDGEQFAAALPDIDNLAPRRYKKQVRPLSEEVTDVKSLSDSELFRQSAALIRDELNRRWPGSGTEYYDGYADFEEQIHERYADYGGVIPRPPEAYRQGNWTPGKDHHLYKTWHALTPKQRKQALKDYADQQEWFKRLGRLESRIKVENVRLTAARIIAMAKKDPALREALEDPYNSGWAHDIDYSYGGHHEFLDLSPQERQAKWESVVNHLIIGKHARFVEDWAREHNEREGYFYERQPWMLPYPRTNMERSAYYWAIQMQESWRGMSDDIEDVNYLLLQMAVNDVMGLGQTRAQLLKAAPYARNDRDFYDLGVKWGHPSVKKRALIARAYAQSVYDATQELFEQMGMDEVLLFRGMSFWRGGPKAGQMGSTRNYGKDVTMTPYPIAAWTPDPGVAIHFGRVDSATEYGGRGFAYGAVVPVERVWATAITGPGALNLAEILVAGSKRDRATILPKLSKTLTFQDIASQFDDLLREEADNSLPDEGTSAPVRPKKPEIHERSIGALEGLVTTDPYSGVLPYFEDPMHHGTSGYENSSEFTWDYMASGIITGDVLGYGTEPRFPATVTEQAHYIPAYWNDEFKKYVLEKADFLNFDGLHPARADRKKVAKVTQVLNLGRGYSVSAQFPEMRGGKKPNVLIKIEKGTPLLDLRDLIEVPDKYEHLALVNGKYRIKGIDQHKDGTLVVTVEAYKWNNAFHASTEDPSPDVSDETFLDMRYASEEETKQHLISDHEFSEDMWEDGTMDGKDIALVHTEQHQWAQHASNDKTHLRHHGVVKPHPTEFKGYEETLNKWIGRVGTLNGKSGDARMVADTILAGKPKDGNTFTAEEVQALMAVAQDTEIPYQVVRYERQFTPFKQFRKGGTVTFGLASTSRNDGGHAERYGNSGGFGADDGGQRVKYMFLPGAHGIDITKYIWDNSEAEDKEHIVTGDYRIVATKVIDGERVVVLEYKGPASGESTIKGNANARKRGVDLGGGIAAETVKEQDFTQSLFETPSLKGTAFEKLESVGKTVFDLDETKGIYREALGNIKPVIESIVGRKSDWSGTVHFEPIEHASFALAQKNWNCDITINETAFTNGVPEYFSRGATQVHALVHEMLHSLSATTSLNGKTRSERQGAFVMHSEWEEGVVELLSLHITANILGMDEGDPAFEGMRLASGYEDLIDGLSELAFILNVSEQDLMVELMQIPINKRGAYIMGLVNAAGVKDEALWALEMLMGEDRANRLWVKFSAGMDRPPKPMNENFPPTFAAITQLVREAGPLAANRWLQRYAKNHPEQEYAMRRLAHTVAMMAEP